MCQFVKVTHLKKYIHMRPFFASFKINYKLCLVLLLAFKIPHPGFGKHIEEKHKALLLKTVHPETLDILADGCSPISTLPCSSLKVNLPFSLNFNAAVSGTIKDKNGKGTGFRTVNNYSGKRLIADGRPASTAVPGYNPSRITLTNGRLQLVANKGIDFISSNNQLNVLGVKTPDVNKIQLEVNLIKPLNGLGSQQAGLWFGLNDKNYLKLYVSGNKVELRREVNDVSSTTTGLDNPDQRTTAVIRDLNTKTVRLKMVVDFAAGTAEGFYSTDGTNYTSTGTLYDNPKLKISGMGLNSSQTHSGIFASYRNGLFPVTYNFDDFSIKDPTTSSFQPVNISFRPKGTSAPSGYKADNGLSYDATRKYGWLSSLTKKPSDYSANMRLRTGSAAANQLPLVQMQSSTNNTAAGIWEYALANGTYRVTVSAGDNGAYYDSNHQLNIEGLPAVSDFRPSSQNKFRKATATVQVSDGKLTIDAAGGSNTKMNYVTIQKAGSIADATAPVVSARLEGTLVSSKMYDKKVRIFLTATDAGGSGLKTFEYAINNGTYSRYTAPFTIEKSGDYSLKVRATDGNGNQTVSSPYLFGVSNQQTNYSFRPASAAGKVPSGYTAETGLPFDAGRGYGWLSLSTQKPADYTGNMRIRSSSGDASQLSFVQIQSATNNTAPGRWEHAVENGTYTVTVSAGDNDHYDSNHQINVEGLAAISDFRPTSKSRFRVAVATVQVGDGKLSIDADGGSNTKINYVRFVPAVKVSDTAVPVVSARLEGTLKSTGVYDKQVKIHMTASDAGGSGLSAFQYAINGGAYISYTGPLLLNKAGDYSLKVRATDANGNQAAVKTYKFSIASGVVKTFAFSSERLSFTVLRGKQVKSQSVQLTASPSTTTLQLSKTEAGWLTLPKAATGTVQFGTAQIRSDIEPGYYQALVTCSAQGYESATLLIDLHVVETLQPAPVYVNFQDPKTIPPLGYIRDSGQPFGTRSGLNQGAELEYGWKKRSDGSLLDISANGRNRNTPEDVLLATLMHMQANDLPNTWNGVRTEAYWEMKLPDGTYDVSVSVGDGDVSTTPEAHSIIVEGISFINQFVPNGKKGTISRFKTVAARVKVADGLLTIQADGGTNTKICSVSIVPVSIDPYLFWATKDVNVIMKQGSTESNTFSVVLGSSDNSAGTYSLSATYGTGAKDWIAFSSAQSGSQPQVRFDYSAAKNLTPGIYKATVKATSGPLTAASFDVQLNVVDSLRPYVISSNPVNGQTHVSLSTVSVAANNLHVPVVDGFQGGVNNKTIDSSTVLLYKLVDANAIPVKGVVQGTGGGDVISFSPSGGLEPNTVYRFVVTSGVKSYTGARFTPFESTFTTAAAKVDSSNILVAQFDKVPVAGTQNKKYTSVAIGPDDRFYALRLDGAIERYSINHSNGTLSGRKTINTLVNKYGSRSAIGLAFDPASTSRNLTVWVSHSSPGLTSAPEFDGNISRLSGDSLQKEQLVITKLPRSRRDHLVNGLAFGPDGALYMCQGSMSSAGSFDADWQRKEALLSGTVLRLDLEKMKSVTLPLNVQTTSDQSLINNAPAMSAKMSDGTYNPYGSSSPLTIYASGVRNAYDLVWHSNGQLYLPTNGSGGGGNSPVSVAGTRRSDGSLYNGPQVDSTRMIKAQNDWLFRVNPNKTVGFYGHPNPLRGEYVLNRGYLDNPLYLPSVKPDANYRPGYNFGLNNSPNGVLEYKSGNFNNALKGKLLVCRFSGGGDIAVMQPGAMTKSKDTSADNIYDIVRVTTGSGNNGLVGMSAFGNPLDITEDVTNGNLYVVEYNWNDSPNLVSQITLLRARATTAAAPVLRVATARQQEPGEEESYAVTMSNDADSTLLIRDITITGEDAARFRVADLQLPNSRQPIALQKNSPVSFRVLGNRSGTQLRKATLVITSMDQTVREVDISDVFLKESDVESQQESARSLSVYPNPAGAGEPVHVVLSGFNTREPVSIYLYDLQGNIIRSFSGITGRDGTLTTQMLPANTDIKSFIIKAVFATGTKSAKVIHFK
ncbi:hypothetical protein GCM10011325_06110 [Dyadobacter sediminis]|nr:hypothetical protein GCM10011325_06110 [Dyadobacter sediminis]